MGNRRRRRAFLCRLTSLDDPQPESAAPLRGTRRFFLGPSVNGVRNGALAATSEDQGPVLPPPGPPVPGAPTVPILPNRSWKKLRRRPSVGVVLP